MCLSTHRASLKKVWERFYVGEIFYPLSKCHCDLYSAESLRFLVPGVLAVTVNAPSARIFFNVSDLCTTRVRTIIV